MNPGFTTTITSTIHPTEAFDTGRTLPLQVGTTEHTDRPGAVVYLNLGGAQAWLSAAEAFTLAEAISNAAADAGYKAILQPEPATTEHSGQPS